MWPQLHCEKSHDAEVNIISVSPLVNLIMVTCLWNGKHTQNFFFELTEICVDVKKKKNPLIFFFRIRLACIVYPNISCIQAPRPAALWFSSPQYCTNLATVVIVSQTGTGLQRHYFVFFFYLSKIMKVIIFYLCLSSLKNFNLSVIFFSQYQW